MGGYWFKSTTFGMEPGEDFVTKEWGRHLLCGHELFLRKNLNCN